MSQSEKINSVSQLNSQQQDEDSDIYEIQKVIGTRIIKGRRQYKILWKGYPLQQATWQPFQNLKNCKQQIKKFRENYKQKKIKKQGNFKNQKKAKIIGWNKQQKSQDVIQISSSQVVRQNIKNKQNKGNIKCVKSEILDQQKNMIRQNDDSHLQKHEVQKNNYLKFKKKSNQQIQQKSLGSKEIMMSDESEEISSQTSNPVKNYAKYIKQLKSQFPATRKQYKDSLIDNAVQTDIWFKSKQTKVIQVLRCQRRLNYIVFQVALQEGNNKKIQWIRNQALKQIDQSKIIEFYQKHMIF